MDSFPNADYILFEPQPVHAEALGLFSAACRQKVTVVDKAVGVRSGETFFHAGGAFGGALAEAGGEEHHIRVELTTLDDCLGELCSGGPYLLKLDTHGYEKGILDGAANTLALTNALVIEAYNHRITDEALLFWELCAYLAEKGFRPVDIVDVMHRPHDRSLWQIDLFFVRSDWPGFEFPSYE